MDRPAGLGQGASRVKCSAGYVRSTRSTPVCQSVSNRSKSACWFSGVAPAETLPHQTAKETPADDATLLYSPMRFVGIVGLSGLLWAVQLVPSKCSISPSSPTANTLLGPVPWSLKRSSSETSSADHP